MRPRSLVRSVVLLLVAAQPAVVARATPPPAPPPVPPPAPTSRPAPPVIRTGPAAIDPATDLVLAEIRRAIEPTEEQMTAITERYLRFREEQWGAIRDVLNARRRDAKPPVAMPGPPDDRNDAAEDAYRQKMKEAQERVQARFLADCRGMLDEAQLEAWDACVADLDLRPGAARSTPFNVWLDRKRGPHVGDEAPAFELTDLDGEPFSLVSCRGRPVVLEFGSYTSPIFRLRVEEMQRLQRAFGDQVHWVLVYTFEAHPEGGTVSRRNVLDNVALPAHESPEDRVKCARLAREKLRLTMRVVIDDFEDTVTTTYSGHPNRGYVIDAEGRIVAKQVWINPAEVERTLRELLPKPDPAPFPQSLDK